MNTKTINLCSLLFMPILALAMMTQSAYAVTVENKASQFDDILDESSSSTKLDDKGGNSEMAEMIRRQRAALDTADKTANAKNTAAAMAKNSQNLCDGGLRACMTDKCGKDFAKCAGDGDTDLGIKFDACRTKTKCSGEEYRLFTTEIKADIAINAQMALYNKTIECGNSYNKCMADECGGDKYTKCLNNAAATRATEKCKKVADDCRQSDTGLANRFGELIGYLRQDAEVTIKADEERLYEMRDKMRSTCDKLGAMFDERTFDCVYTVNFFAGDDQITPMASKKLYAGSTFDCNQDWFGVDVTTFKENAYRFTRSETAATSAFMGAGLGVAAGSITSGAIGRAIDTKKAKDALDDAKKEAGEDDDNKKSSSSTDKASDIGVEMGKIKCSDISNRNNCKKRDDCDWKGTKCIDKTSNSSSNSSQSSNKDNLPCADHNHTGCTRNNDRCEWKDKKCVDKPTTTAPGTQGGATETKQESLFKTDLTYDASGCSTLYSQRDCLTQPMSCTWNIKKQKCEKQNSGNKLTL